MTDDPTPDSPFPPTPEARTGSEPFNLNAPRPTGRPVYESTLLAGRRRRRFSPWLVVPSLLIGLLGLLYFLVAAPRPRPAVHTAGQVVYAATAAGGSHLWVVQADGSVARPLTSGPGSDSSPAFTDDGKQIAFLSNRAGGQNQIYLVDGDGKNLTQITRNAGAKTLPVFAPGSNTLLGFISGGTLAAADVGKESISLLLPPPGPSAHSSTTDADTSHPQEAASTVVGFAWKPVTDQSDPGLAAVLDSSGVQTLAILPDLSSPPHLTQNDKPDGPPLAAADTISIAWAPDGTRLAVALLRAFGPPDQPKLSGLFLFDSQGSVQSRLFVMPPNSVTGPQNPVYSPDGSLIAFELWRQPDLASRTRIGLYIAPASGGAPRLLAKGDAGAAQFSRDGKQVFFLARRHDGGHDLWRTNADGAGALRLTDGRSDVTGYALSPQAQTP